MIGVKVGYKEIMIANIGGEIYAMGNICTHMGCLLSKGNLEEGRVTCSCHSAVFEVKTGRGFWGSGTAAIALRPEPIYEVKIQGEDILIRI